MIVEVHSPSGWKVVSDATLQDLAVDSFLVILPLSKAIRSDRLPQLRIRIGGREAATVNLEAVEPAADGGSLVSYEVLL